MTLYVRIFVVRFPPPPVQSSIEHHNSLKCTNTDCSNIVENNKFSKSIKNATNMIIIEVCLPVAIVVISSASEIGQLKSRLDKSASIEDDFFDQIISSYMTT